MTTVYVPEVTIPPKYCYLASLICTESVPGGVAIAIEVGVARHDTLYIECIIVHTVYNYINSCLPPLLIPLNCTERRGESSGGRILIMTAATNR